MKPFNIFIIATAVVGTSLMSINLAVARGWIKASASDVGSGGFVKDFYCTGNICFCKHQTYDMTLGAMLVKHEINSSAWQFRAKPKSLSASYVVKDASQLSSNSLNQV